MEENNKLVIHVEKLAVAKSSVFEQITLERSITIQRAIKGNNLQSLEKKHDFNTLVYAIGNIINNATEFFNGSGTAMTQNQALQTAALLIESYPAETIEDVILCLRYAKTGKYGKVFNRIDGQIIFEWFRQYLDEKYTIVEDMHRDNKIIESEKRINELSMVSEGITQVLASINKKTEPEKKQNESVNRITHEQHIDQFKSYVLNLGLPDLNELLVHYETKNKSHGFWNNLDEYVSIIKETIQHKNSQND